MNVSMATQFFKCSIANTTLSSFRVFLISFASSFLLTSVCGNANGQETATPGTKLTDKERDEVLKLRDKINKQIKALVKNDQLQEAISSLDQVFDLEVQVYGPAHEVLMQTIDQRIALAERAEQFEVIIELRQKALEIGQRLYSNETFRVNELNQNRIRAERFAKLTKEQRREASVATFLAFRYGFLSQQGNLADAVSSAKEHLAILDRLFGKDDLEYAYGLGNLAALLTQKAEFVESERIGVEAMAILERLVGSDHPRYLRVVNNLAWTYALTGDYGKSEPLYWAVKEKRQALCGTNHIDYVSSLYSLGGLYARMGDYDRATTFLLEAKTICSALKVVDKALFGLILCDLGKVAFQRGNYAEAEQFSLNARTTLEETFGKTHPHVAVVLDNLGQVYCTIGEPQRAAAVHLEANKILADSVGNQHPLFATNLAFLAHVYCSVSDYDRSKALLEDVLSLREKSIGTKPGEYLISLLNLANSHARTGGIEKASAILVKAKTLARNTCGPESYQFASCLIIESELHEAMGQLSEAIDARQTANSVLVQVIGEQRLDIAVNLSELGRMQALNSENVLAHRNYSHSLSVIRKCLYDASFMLSESRQIAIVSRNRYCLDRNLRLLSDAQAEHQLEELLGLSNKITFENVLLSKGSTVRSLRNTRVGIAEPTIAGQFRKLRSVSAQISSLIQQSINLEESSRWKERLANLTSEKEQLEAELMRKSAVFAKANRQVTLEDIQKAIPKDGVLVDYLEFNGKEGLELVASIVYPSSEPQMVFLGSTKELGARIDRWLGSHGDTSEAQQAGQELRKQLWEPLLPLIENSKIILVSTDGDLGRFPIAALPGKEAGKYLIEEHRLVMIPVPQLLPELMESNSPSDLPRGLLAMGAIDYNAAPEAVPKGQPAESETKKNLGSLAMRTRSDLPAGVRGNSQWDPLDATGPEVDFVTKLYTQKHNSPDSTIVKLDRSAASEASFRALATGSKFIHLATHGFFADPDKKSALSSEIVAQSAQDEMFSLGDKHKIIRGHNPGQLSGLVFAGANRPAPIITIDNLTENHGENDGILTADEIAFLRLEGCELVVLSACQTGLGATAGGEGILGLQRSFQLAGARSVVSSLWNVNDEATNQLMQLFYTNVWTHKQSKLDALRNAQLDMLNFYDSDTHKLSTDKTRADRSQPVEMKLVPKEDQQVSKSIDRSKRLSPRFWAAFQLSGDWR